jgi:hypothetical protein
MIRIQWEANASTRNDDTGGDTADLTIGELTLDATITEVTDISAEATEHPVEEGANITDHVRPALIRVQLECKVSNTPTHAALVEGASLQDVDLELPGRTGFSGGSVFLKAATTRTLQAFTIPARVLAFADEFDRPVEVVDQLTALMQTGTRVDILGLRLGDMEQVLLLGMSPEVNVGDAVHFTLMAQELRTGHTEEVEAPAPLVERGRRQRNRGRQSGTGDGDENENGRSTARSIYDQLSEGPLQGVLPGLQ